EQRLHSISAQGVPNYFGEQRFGHHGNNLNMAHQLFAGKPVRDKQKRGLVLSASRSYLFMLVIASRVRDIIWYMLRTGDTEKQPSGQHWGRGRLASTEETRRVEEEALKDWTEWCNGLEHVGLQQERRPLKLKPQEMSWQWEEADSARHLQLAFSLESGA